MPEPRKPLPEFVLAEGLDENRLELTAAEAPAQDAAPKPRRFKMLAYTGGEMIVGGFGRVVVDVAGVQLPAGAFPILVGHDIAKIAGIGQAVKADGGKIRIDGTLSSVTASGQEVAALGDEGFPWQASIGLRPTEIVAVATGNQVKVNGKTFKGPLLVATKSVLKESSFVPLGADDKTHGTVLAASAQLAAQTAAPEPTEGAPTMPEDKKPETPPAAPVQASIKELKALEGADGDFVVAQFEKGATLAEAREALQAREVARLKAENEALKKAAEAPKKPTGVKGLEAKGAKEGEQAGAEADANPRAVFKAEVAKLMQAGLSRSAAVSQVVRDQPELQRAMLDAANEGKKDLVASYAAQE